MIAFEPVLVIADDLQATVLANDLNDCVHAHRLALSDSVGRISIFTPGSATTGVIETVLRGQNISDAEGIVVDMSTLDQFVFADRNPVPEVIKLDVEGERT